MKRQRGFTVAAAALLAAVAAFAVQAAEPDMKPEVYTAVAMNMNAGPGPSTSRLTVRIKRWSTEEERAALLKVLAEQGSEKLVEALRKEKSIGNLNFTGTVGYDFRYARQYQADGTRHVVLATDRPVTMRELRSSARSLDKGVTLVHLVFPPGGEASGELLVGAELKLDAATHELTLEHLGTTPVRLTQVSAQ